MYPSRLLARITNATRHHRIPLLNARFLTTSHPPASSNHSEAHSTRSYQVITRLAKAACALREAIDEDARQGVNDPRLLLDLERDVDSAFAIVNKALRGIDQPLTVEHLADRNVDDELVGLGNALSYSDILQAQLTRDDIENTLVNLQVMPPADTLLKGAGSIPWKGSNKERKGAESTDPTQNLISLSEEEQTPELKELYPVTEQQLAERKKQLERATNVKHLLRGFDTALLEVSRVHKVVKGGTNMSMRALVAIGNRKGTAGFGEGKSENAQHAIERACRDARRNLLSLDLREGRTLHHRVRGSFVKTKVTVWPAPRGAGIAASNQFSVILELFGLEDVGAKLRGTRPLTNSVKALFNALSKNSTAEGAAALRGDGFLVSKEIRTRKAVRIRGGL